MFAICLLLRPKSFPSYGNSGLSQACFDPARQLPQGRQDGLERIALLGTGMM